MNKTLTNNDKVQNEQTSIKGNFSQIENVIFNFEACILSPLKGLDCNSRPCLEGRIEDILDLCIYEEMF